VWQLFHHASGRDTCPDCGDSKNFEQKQTKEIEVFLRLLLLNLIIRVIRVIRG
jgi:hypothetical protein